MSVDLDDHLDADEGGRRPGYPVDPGRLWASVKQDWRWLPIAGLVWGVCGLLVAFMVVKHSFKSEAILIWETGAPGGDSRRLATQAGSLRLPGALRKVKDRLHLPVPIEALGQQYEVYFDEGSNLVRVEAIGGSARDAALMANTLIEVFLDQQRAIARAQAQDAVDALDKDAQAARAALLKARLLYDAFRDAQGVTNIEEETRLTMATAARLEQEQQAANAEANSLAAQATQIGDAVRKQSRFSVQGSSSSDPDAIKLAELRSQLASGQARFSADHPRLASLQAQISALEVRVKKGSSVVSGVTTAANPEYQALQSNLSGARAGEEAARKRKDTYADLAKTTEQRLASLSAIEGKARMYQADLKLAEERVRTLDEQLSSARDAVRSPQMEWRVLTPALPPEWPERSKRRAIAAGMPIGGVLLALLVLLVRPVLDGRVYTAREAGFWANFPVIGASTWPRSRETLFALVDELGDQTGAATGYTLVIGATERERPMAEELAFLLGARTAKVAAEPHVVNVVPSAPAPATSTPAPSSARTSPGHDPAPSDPSRPVTRAEALVRVQPGVALNAPVTGTHAWLGTTEGPSLRRAARMADRVIVLLTSGADLFTSVASLRTQLGREDGVGLVVVGLSPEFVNLPDRAGNVDRFWRGQHRS